MIAPLEIVWARSLLGAEVDDYDHFVARSRSGHYAQTRGFCPVERAKRSSVARYVLVREQGRLVGAALLCRAALGPLPLPWAVVERGPVCQRPEDLARVASALARTARAHGVLRLSVMPYWADEEADTASRALAEAGFRDAQRPDGAHARTLRIDLTGLEGGQEAFLAEPGRERLRMRSKQAARAGAVARLGTREDFNEHERLTALIMRAQGKRSPSSSYYETLWKQMLSDDSRSFRGALFVGELQGRILATVVVLRHGGIAIYAQGASTLEPSKISKSVPPLLAAIRWAHQAGCHTFDLGGIPDEGDADPKRHRIAHLKLDFARGPVRLVRRHERFL
jgi:lipid II:glycine glycyltransferase (peptidoglycan interpeptide bridge formation enzyme)